MDKTVRISATRRDTIDIDKLAQALLRLARSRAVAASKPERPVPAAGPRS